MERITKVEIIYPADPVGVIPGGVDTYIRGLIATAPEDIEIALVGITTDPKARPVGRWTECSISSRRFLFFPVLWEREPGKRKKVPLSIRFILGLLRYRPKTSADVLEFHRIEPVLLYLRDQRPKNTFVHQNMQILTNASSDILWSKMPALYYSLEKFIYSRVDSVFAVREDAVAWYRTRFPMMAEKFKFIPTWMDPALFHLPTTAEKENANKNIRETLGMEDGSPLLITVGRLDEQKQPLLLASAFRRVHAENSSARLVYVGDGKLRSALEAFVKKHELQYSIILAGLKSQTEIVQYLWAADLFVLSSAYEGMPMSVLESLGAGCPVVATEVGEVPRIIKPGINGFMVRPGDEEALANTMLKALDYHWDSKMVSESVSEYTPEYVLRPVYDEYRKLGATVHS